MEAIARHETPGRHARRHAAERTPSRAEDARALADCLSFLEQEARRIHLDELAYLIGIATVSARDETSRLRAMDAFAEMETEGGR